MKEYYLTINHNEYKVVIDKLTETEVTALVNGKEMTVGINEIKRIVDPTTAVRKKFVPPKQPINTHKVQSIPTGVKAPIPGQIIELFVKEGDQVKAGQKVLMMEAMKLENEIDCPKDGKVKKICVQPGESVEQDQILIEMEY